MDFANVKRFFYWDVKAYMLLFLSIIAVYSLFTAPVATLPLKAAHYLVAVGTCMALSLAVRMLVKKKEFKLSKDAAITGLIIAVILDPRSLVMTAVVSALAIALKNIIRFEGRPLFNPAAIALIVGVMLFNVELSWWAVNVFTLLGIWIVYRMGRVPLVASFLVVFLSIDLITFLSSELGRLVFFDNPLLWLAQYGTFFFAFFMLTEPKTTPITRNSQLVFGSCVAAVAFLHGTYLPGLDAFLIALLLMNALRPILEKKIR